MSSVHRLYLRHRFYYIAAVIKSCVSTRSSQNLCFNEVKMCSGTSSSSSFSSVHTAQCSPKVRLAPASTVSWQTTVATCGRRLRPRCCTTVKRPSRMPSSASTSSSGTLKSSKVVSQTATWARMVRPFTVLNFNVIVFFVFSSVEQPDVIFSMEQTRCSSIPKVELADEDSGTADMCESKTDSTVSTEAEDVDSDSSSSAKLFMELREKPEELLQLAPDAGDTIVPLSPGEANRGTPPSFFFLIFFFKYINLKASFMLQLRKCRRWLFRVDLSPPLSGSVELSFASPPSPNLVPEHPQDLCTPQLRKLLAPIFDPITPPPSASSSSSSSSPSSSPKLEQVNVSLKSLCISRSVCASL